MSTYIVLGLLLIVIFVVAVLIAEFPRMPEDKFWRNKK